ncbi:adenylyl-sulfate kinase [Arthrobacter flavus]|uniref:adenylyl-sulfate kinase n=1 Tax=Arthrobacter flavus TaxID=95172 RepID=A0ABW4Q8X2_9MICC
MSVRNTLLTEPALALEGAKLDELELLLGGLYAPANGYCLPEQRPPGWPAEFTLGVPVALAREALHRNAMLLTDPDGTPLVRLMITAFREEPGIVHLAGDLVRLQPAEHPPARHLRLTEPLPRPAGGRPQQIVAAVFTTDPSAEDMARAVSNARDINALLVLLAIIDSSQTGSRAGQDLIAGLLRCAGHVTGATVRLLVLPGAPPSHEAGQRDLRHHVLQQIDADLVLDFAAGDTGPTQHTDSGALRQRGLVVLFTGFSGSGKSTVARELVERLRSTDDRPVTLLDGDSVRRMLSSGLGFSRVDRELNVRRIGWVAAQIAGAGGIAVCAPIAPYDSTRQEVRQLAEAVGGFLLVHVSTPMDICEQRDRKGLYAKARAGLIPEFTGIDSPYEVPQEPDCAVDTSVTGVSDAVDLVLAAIQRHSGHDSM